MFIVALFTETRVWLRGCFEVPFQRFKLINRYKWNYYLIIPAILKYLVLIYIIYSFELAQLNIKNHKLIICQKIATTIEIETWSLICPLKRAKPLSKSLTIDVVSAVILIAPYYDIGDILRHFWRISLRRWPSGDYISRCDKCRQVINNKIQLWDWIVPERGMVWFQAVWISLEASVSVQTWQERLKMWLYFRVMSAKFVFSVDTSLK